MHHGSARQDAALHRLLRPRVAIVSAGQDNPYGHPAPRALELLASAGAVVLRTDSHGDVAVGGSAEELWVAVRRGDPPLVAPAVAPAAGAAAGPVSAAGGPSHRRGRLAPWQDAGAAARAPRRGRRSPRRRSCW
jgi:competence protein ComEC